ncbi:plastocyanin/azurin family copper-binding protein [Haloarcula onubensis]|uniref:plastocyanin/azurin family copper-binding protein n=1 Tax=Haloarcula onubensis TaxID=2950539 RepID=UPI00287BBC52|nr:plastocyanin/azurin family copper-binding protein [Halomicroarcula sp. S3CR25-11]
MDGVFTRWLSTSRHGRQSGPTGGPRCRGGRVDAGTTVTWVGTGNSYNVVHERGDFESDLTAEEGSTFEHTFESAGTYLYYCAPHLGFGMRGAVVVE